MTIWIDDDVDDGDGGDENDFDSPRLCDELLSFLWLAFPCHRQVWPNQYISYDPIWSDVDDMVWYETDDIDHYDCYDDQYCLAFTYSHQV